MQTYKSVLVLGVEILPQKLIKIRQIACKVFIEISCSSVAKLIFCSKFHGENLSLAFLEPIPRLHLRKDQNKIGISHLFSLDVGYKMLVNQQIMQEGQGAYEQLRISEKKPARKP